uniref:Uncharacterized protein n=1 Tax=Panagrolaimus davidi TaxID=227884 RepID=A0A914QHS8_9BILA
MKFLKDKDQIAYLNLYRRYTRFYIEDKQMVEEYRNEIDRISKISKIPVSEFWIDTILYEFDFGTKDTAKKIFARALATILPNIWPNQNLNIEIPHFPALPTIR